MTTKTAFSGTPDHKAAAAARDAWIAMAILGVWLLVALVRQWNHWPEDLSAVYIAGFLWQTGQPELIYAAPEHFFGGHAPSWTPTLLDLGGPDAVTFPYIYPPIWAVLIAPLTRMTDVLGFANAVSLIQFPMLVASILLAARLFRPAAMPLWLWALIGAATLSLSIQSQLTLGLNQPTITVVFLILLSFERMQSGQPVAAGAALAIAAAIKISPVFLAVVFVIDRQYRAFAAFVIVGAILGLMSLFLAGIDMHREFLSALSLPAENTLLSVTNISLKPAILAIMSMVGYGEPMDITRRLIIMNDVPTWLVSLSSLAGLAYCVPVLYALRRWPSAERRVLMLLVLSIIIPLTGPLGWLHYYLLPMFLLPGFIVRLPRSAARITGIAMGFGCLTGTGAVIVLILPQPLAGYVWFQCALWMFMLAVIARFAFKGPKAA
jgi:hypothetical protein